MSTTDTYKVHIENPGDIGAPTGGATSAKQDTQITAEQAILAKLTSDPATQTTLAAVLAKIIAAPATEAKQDTGNTSLSTIATSLASIDAGIPAALGPATAANSMPVTLSTDGAFATNFGAIADSEASNDTGSFSFLAFVKRLLNTKLKIGQQTKANSLSVSLASDYQAPIIPTNTTPTWSNIAANNTDGIASMDVSNYASGTLQLTGTWNATVNIQFSLDGGTTWVAALVFNLSSASTSASIGSNGIILFAIPRGAQMRIRTVAYTSGTVVGNLGLSSIPYTPLHLMAVGGTGSNAYGTNAGTGDGLSPTTSLFTIANQYVSTGSTTRDAARTPTTFKTATATASGDTALWTPTSGKKFRLMRFRIEVTGDAATSGGAVIDVLLRDSTTATGIGFSVFVPATGVTTSEGVLGTGWIDLGNGILSAAANNVLNINLSAALSAGKVRVVCCGTEE